MAIRSLTEALLEASDLIGPVYHGSPHGGLTEIYGGWWGDDPRVTSEFGRFRYKAFLRGPLADGGALRSLYIAFAGDDTDPDSGEQLTDHQIADEAMSGGPFARHVENSGYRGISVWDDSNDVVGMAYSVFDAEDVRLITSL